jgi:hypothetical protein
VSFYVSTATFFLLHCDEWDCLVALPRHKFVTGATLLQLSCIQCNSIVRMIGIFSGTNMIKKVPICLFEVLICLIEVPNCPGADLSWYWNVSHSCRSQSWYRFVPVSKCLELVQNSGWSYHLSSGQLLSIVYMWLFKSCPLDKYALSWTKFVKYNLVRIKIYPVD